MNYRTISGKVKDSTVIITMVAILSITIAVFVPYLPLIMVFLVGAIVAVIVVNQWKFGLTLLIGYMPFSGLLPILFYPNRFPILFKDVFIVIPMYVSFAIHYLNMPDQEKLYVPKIIRLMLFSLFLIVLIEMFNSHVPNWLVAIIGAKTWLLYVPLLFLTNTSIKRKMELIKVFRLMVSLSWFPSVVGIIQWVGSVAFGYQRTVELFLGRAAGPATQNFTTFDIGMGFFRIPSIFTFVAQFFGFTLAMLVPAFALSKIDPNRNWRLVGKISVIVISMSSFLSGERGAFLFVPLIFVMTYIFEIGLSKPIMAFHSLLLPLLLSIGMSFLVLRSSIVNLYTILWGLIVHYGKEIVYKGFVLSISQAPWGLGTGINTGSARYVFPDPTAFVPFENYYAKAVYELGVVGLGIILLYNWFLLSYGYKNHRRLKKDENKLHSCSAVLLAFILMMSVNSLKGWQIDLDPINIYFWMFAGILLKLPYLI